MINAVTSWLLNLVGLAATLGVMAAGFLYLVNSPEKAKALLGRVVAGACLAVVSIILVNSYLNALAGGDPVAIGILVAVSAAAYVVRLAKRRARGGAPNNRRGLLGR